MDWLQKILPTIGSLLVPGGPMVGAAVEAVAGALGLTDATEKSIKDTLASGRLTPEAIQSLKTADNELRLKLEELGIKAEELVVKDRGDARAMQIATGSWVPATMGFILVGTFLVIVCCLLIGTMKLWDSQTLTMLLGQLTGAVTAVVAFYYGASHQQPKP
jgi:hypothetical protein